jgi:ABC-type Co2+ transport system permease subunit
VYRAGFKIAGSRTGRVPAVAAAAAFLSVPMAALGFVVEFMLGGTISSLSTGAILIAMVSTHTLIGIGEGVITFFVVGAVLKARSDLVYGAPTFAGRRTEGLPE